RERDRRGVRNRERRRRVVVRAIEAWATVRGRVGVGRWKRSGRVGMVGMVASVGEGRARRV
ncbi:hypothetical protein, partial [Paraburkholderia ginsengiterrae]|uniref:hypothetical protein n=1 Tax=Paraburkholderia ginsengiterrae TaxID=1462993 RepID=UPI001ABFD4DF